MRFSAGFEHSKKGYNILWARNVIFSCLAGLTLLLCALKNTAIWKSFYCPHSHVPANMKQIGAVLAMLRLFPCAAPARRHVPRRPRSHVRYQFPSAQIRSAPCRRWKSYLPYTKRSENIINRKIRKFYIEAIPNFSQLRKKMLFFRTKKL